jgi:hypothetical protein
MGIKLTIKTAEKRRRGKGGEQQKKETPKTEVGSGAEEKLDDE